MPQAIEWSLATPMISPRLPCISPCMKSPTFPQQQRRVPPTHRTRYSPRKKAASRLRTLEHHARVGPTKPERIRQHATEGHVVPPLAHNRHVREGRIHGLDVGALADEAVLHHQQRVDCFLHPGSPERMACERLGRRDWRAIVAKH